MLCVGAGLNRCWLPLCCPGRDWASIDKEGEGTDFVVGPGGEGARRDMYLCSSAVLQPSARGGMAGLEEKTEDGAEMTTRCPAEWTSSATGSGHERRQRQTWVVGCLALEPHFVPWSNMQIKRMQHRGLLGPALWARVWMQFLQGHVDRCGKWWADHSSRS